MHIPLKIKSSWIYCEIAEAKLLPTLIVYNRKFCVSPPILQYHFFFNNISHPTMAASNRRRPVYLTSLPLRWNGYFHGPIPCNHNKFILIVAKSGGAKADSDNDRHARSNIPTVFSRITDICNYELFLLEWSHLDPLNIFWIVDQPHLWLVDAHSFVVAEV
jgi:hypothetical protein